LRLEPGEKGSGILFKSAITGSTLPTEWYGPIEAGYREAARAGIVAGYPCVDITAVLTGGSYHDVDSSEMAFKVAGSMAFKAAMEKAAPALLEPIMKMEVIAPSEFLGDVLGDLNSRRAQILSMENEGDTQVVQAYVPLADTFQYATKLRSLSTGRAIFTMQLDHYDQVPKHIADQVAGSNAKSS
jgi:elongation factor G